jgi:predicted GIY-YIG superfamily endonuclease
MLLEPSAIYFLSDGENVIYVGQSRNVKRRLARHPIKYVYAWYEPCDPERLNDNEAKAMRAHASLHLLNKNANGQA